MSGRLKRYYVHNDLIDCDEDQINEFKGHKNLTIDDIPPWGKAPNERSRGPISKAINAFLNTGMGGTVYLGVVDEGTIKGLNMTQYTKDHLKVALDDLMASYAPPVERHRYKLTFVPVVDPKASPEEIEEVLSYDSTIGTDQELRQRPHVFRSHNYCWCDKDAVARFNIGVNATLYVVEIHLKPWDKADPRHKYPVGEMRGYPIHENEEGKVYFRRQASVVQYTAQEVLHLAKRHVGQHYQPEIDGLKKLIAEAKEKQQP